MNETAPSSVIVVGGGVVGIACAHYLSEAGLQVTVVEKGEIGGECSHANCGYVCPSHVPPLTEPGAFRVALKSLFNPNSPFRVKPSLSPSLLQWMFQFAIRCNEGQVLSAGKHLQSILDASIDEYRGLMKQYDFDCEWRERGLLYVFRSERAHQEFAAVDEMLTEHFGVTATRIGGNELHDFEPGLRQGLFGGFHYPGDASLRPDLLNRAWVEQLRKRGVRLRQQCSLEKILVDTDRIQGIETSQGRFQADHYVFAMGAISSQWSQQLRVQIPIQPGKGYSVTLERPAGCPTHPILFPEEKVGVSPFETGMRLGSMMEFVGYDASIPKPRIQQLRDAARPYLVASVDGPAEETWYGWRPMTWDSLPIIGQLPKLPNGFLATGHNMIGLTLAPATGRLMAELVTGKTPHLDPTPYSVERF